MDKQQLLYYYQKVVMMLKKEMEKVNTDNSVRKYTMLGTIPSKNKDEGEFDKSSIQKRKYITISPKAN